MPVCTQEYRKGIPCIVVANKIDLDMKVTKKSFNFAPKRNLPFYFVSASEGTNVVKVFSEAIAMGHKYMLNPDTDDFMAEVMDLLNEESPLDKLEKAEAEAAGGAP
mmetsp:Transcript_25117/g.61757  ORF Transcript_25117/g.61757 Transcript_25117/m.61757 type:complete len:106 (+) Transcript_25117:129-446(+)